MEFMTSLQSGLDEQKPSLFELLSEQQLASLIPPSLRYLLALATHRHPRYLLRILNSFDEVYALLSLLVERHYLRTYGGGFTENFYDLKRERVLRIKNGEVPRASLGAPEHVRETLRLRDSDVWKNLAIMVALPYVKRKLDESYDIHAAHANILGPAFQNRDQLSHDASIKQRILYYYKWFLRKVYPSVNAAYYFSLLAFNLAYLFDGSKYHSPFLYMIGTRIRRLNEADHKAIAMATQPAAPRQGAARPGQTNSIFSPRTLTHTVYPRLLSSLKILLPTSIFALKFLEWWHASDFARQLSRKAAEGLELPPPTISGLPPSNPASGKPATATTSSSSNSSNSNEKVPSGVTFATTISEKPDPFSPESAPTTTTTNPIPTKSRRTNPNPPPISSTSLLPIYTIPPSYSSELCPICLAPITTPTAAQTGYVYCYTCIFKWVEGEHARQVAFMAGERDAGGEWRDDDDENDYDYDDEVGDEDQSGEDGDGGDGGSGDEAKRKERSIGSREGKWESGVGRCAVTGRKILGGTGGLRRVMV